jgi:AsmA protein
MNTRIIKWLKGIGIGIASLLLLLFLLPILFPGQIESKIKSWINESVDAKINFSKVRLSFFRQFPTLTLSLHDFTLTGAAPFQADTLMAGEALSFGINIGALFNSELVVDRFFIEKAKVKILIDDEGRANYSIYKGKADTTQNNDQPGSATSMQIRGIDFNDCSLYYHDASLPMTIESPRFDYEGRGLLDQEEFDLTSSLHTNSLSFTYDGITYLDQRSIDADMITGVNTYSLAFRFQKNNVLVNKLPVDFTGTLFFLKDGYDIDLSLVSGTTDFGNVFSILPPAYESWFESTRFSGKSKVTFTMKGSYRAGSNEYPDMHIGCRLTDGSIRHNKAPEALKNVNLAADIHIPGMDPDSMVFQIDTLAFTLKNQPTLLSLRWEGMESPYVMANLDSKLDLGLLDQAIGWQGGDLRGLLTIKAEVDGQFKSGQNPDNFRPDTILLSVPSHNLQATIKDGYLKYADLPLALSELTADIRSELTGNRWQDIQMEIKSLHARPGSGELSGHASLKGLNPSVMDSRIQLNLPMQEMNQIFPMEGFDYAGLLKADFTAQGKLDKSGRSFPKMELNASWANGKIQTPYVPSPVENIALQAEITNTDADFSTLSILIPKCDFRFNNRPFSLNASFKNLNDLAYDIKADGTLQLDSLYRVFGVADYKFGGDLNMQLDLRGRQSDIEKKQYRNLYNAGYIEAAGLLLKAKEYPAPFYLPIARLEFQRENLWMKNAELVYKGHSFFLNGNLQQLIGYIMGQSNLVGELSMEGKKLVVDDFMAFESSGPENGADSSNSSEGVVLLPTDLDLKFRARFDTVQYGESVLHRLQGQLTIKNGALQLTETTAELAGAALALTADYKPESLRSAQFALTAKADSFDVQKAYQELAIFREMAPAAAYTRGLVTADYVLNGRLNELMKPVYPSISGKGKIVLEQVQVKGLKLFSAVSKATGKDSINNPNLKAVVIKSSIRNNLITIERTRMRIFGFRPRVEGQVSLDGKLNLRFRLGLPPLGIIGIPMTVTGSSEQPIVKVRRGREEDELEETMDEEPENPEQEQNQPGQNNPE